MFGAERIGEAYEGSGVVSSRHLPGGTRENNENLGQDIRCRGRDSNWTNFKIKLYISPAKRKEKVGWRCQLF